MWYTGRRKAVAAEVPDKAVAKMAEPAMAYESSRACGGEDGTDVWVARDGNGRRGIARRRTRYT